MVTTCSGTVVTVPVLLPVIVTVCDPPCTAAGRTNDTEALPYSSKMSVPMVLSTAKSPTATSPTLTDTEVSFLSAAVEKASDDRLNATVWPVRYCAGAPAGKLTPTDRWV